jgi:hypothetical protein
MGSFSFEKSDKGQLIIQTDKGHYYPGEVATGTVYIKVGCRARVNKNPFRFGVFGKQVIRFEK